MALWSAWGEATSFLQSAGQTVMAQAATARDAMAPVVTRVTETAAPLAHMAREQASGLGAFATRAAGPKTSAQMRGWTLGTRVTERGLLRAHGAGLGRWTDVTALLKEGVLKIYEGWEALEGDVPRLQLTLDGPVQVEEAPPEEGEEAHCLAIATPKTGGRATTLTRLVLQANGPEEHRLWVGLLQGVSAALAMRTRAGHALQAGGQAAGRFANTTGLAWQARGFFTSAAHEGALQVPPAVLGEEPSASSAGSTMPEAPATFTDAWVVLAHGQLKVYKDMDDFELLGTPSLVIDLHTSHSVVEHGALEFELVETGITASAASGGPPTGPHRFKAILPEDRDVWVGLLRGVERSLAAKAGLATSVEAVEGAVSQATTVLRTRYQEFTQEQP